MPFMGRLVLTIPQHIGIRVAPFGFDLGPDIDLPELFVRHWEPTCWTATRHRRRRRLCRFNLHAEALANSSRARSMASSSCAVLRGHVSRRSRNPVAGIVYPCGPGIIVVNADVLHPARKKQHSSAAGWCEVESWRKPLSGFIWVCDAMRFAAMMSRIVTSGRYLVSAWDGLMQR